MTSDDDAALAASNAAFRDVALHDRLGMRIEHRESSHAITTMELTEDVRGPACDVLPCGLVRLPTREPVDSGRVLKGVVAALCAISFVLVLTPARASASKVLAVRGGWIGAIPCIFTSYTPSSGAATAGTFSCESGSFWDGGWTGQTQYNVKGKIDFLSGNSTGTITETFVGVYTGDQSSGTLTFVERYRLDGATNGLHIDLKITSGTGDWVGSRGTTTFDGTQFLGVAGHGGYTAKWIRR